MSHVDEQLSDYVLEALGKAERAAVEAHLLGCPRCAAEVLSAREALSGLAAEPAADPSPEARLRLLHATRPIQPRKGCKDLAQLAAFLDLPPERAQLLLDKASNPAAWIPGRAPGMAMMYVRPGPAHQGADATFVRLDGGFLFPFHGHAGLERTLMLEGGALMSDGREMHPGDQLDKRPGDEHAFVVLPEGCMYVAVVFEGIVLPGLGTFRARR